MAEDDAVKDAGAEPPADAPSLELPSLFGRRRKRSKNVEPPAAEVEPPSVPDEPPAASVEPTTEVEPPSVPDEPTLVQGVRDTTTVIPVVTAPPEDTTEVRPPLVQDQPQSGASVGAAEPPVPADDMQVVDEEDAATPVDLPPGDTVPVPVVDATDGATETAPDVQDKAPAEVETHAQVETGSADIAVEPPRARRRTVPRLPALAATTAAVAVGAVVGLLGCALTFLGLRLCEVMAGTSSCGGPGLLLLLLIVVLMVLAGAALLRLFMVEDAGNLSFLGVGITVAAVLIFLLDYLYQPWMFVVMPVLTAAAFAVARWITTRYVEDVLADDDDSEMHDVR